MNLSKDDWAELFLLAIHEQCGLCSHCGKRKCNGRKDGSTLPDKIKVTDIEAAIKAMPS